jgi:purine-binding chemotaxis protein CheW
MIELPDKISANFDLSSMDLLDLGDPFFSDEKAAEIKGEKYIVFFINMEIYAVISKPVAEVFQPLGVTPLPNIPEWLIGITNFRNRIISVVDLQKLCQKENSTVSPKSKLIVLRSENDEARIAFTIDKFSEIVTLPDESIQRVNNQNSPYIYGKTIHKSNTLTLIDAEKLLCLNL